MSGSVAVLISFWLLKCWFPMTFLNSWYNSLKNNIMQKAVTMQVQRASLDRIYSLYSFPLCYLTSQSSKVHSNKQTRKWGSKLLFCTRNTFKSTTDWMQTQAATAAWLKTLSRQQSRVKISFTDIFHVVANLVWKMCCLLPQCCRQQLGLWLYFVQSHDCWWLMQHKDMQ